MKIEIDDSQVRWIKNHGLEYTGAKSVEDYIEKMLERKISHWLDMQPPLVDPPGR